MLATATRATSINLDHHGQHRVGAGVNELELEIALGPEGDTTHPVVETYFIRHSRRLDISEATRQRLWDERLIALHYPYDRNGKWVEAADNESLDSADYCGKAKQYMNALHLLATDGGYVCAQYFGHTELLIGTVPPNTKLVLLRGEWGSRQRIAALKTVQLKDAKTLHPRDHCVIAASRPWQGTISPWHAVGDALAAIIEQRVQPLSWGLLSTYRQEVGCSEFLRLDKAAARYLAQKSERQRERLLGRRITIARLRKGRVLRQSNPWDRWEDKLLGTVPDRQLVRRLKRSRTSVAIRRRGLGIVANNPTYRPWTKRQDRLLGRFSDETLARRLGRTPMSVRHRRSRLRIGNPNSPVRPWTKAEEALLGTLRDEQLARRLRVSLARGRFERAVLRQAALLRLTPAGYLGRQARTCLASLRPGRAHRLPQADHQTQQDRPVIAIPP